MKHLILFSKTIKSHLESVNAAFRIEGRPIRLQQSFGGGAGTFEESVTSIKSELFHFTQLLQTQFIVILRRYINGSVNQKILFK